MSLIEHPFAIKVNTENIVSSAEPLISARFIEREPELNLKDLESPDEELSAEPFGGRNYELP